MSSRELSYVLDYLVVRRFDLYKKFSELVGYPASDSGSNLSNSTDNHNLSIF